jgi:hypothetical protein
MTGTVDGMHMAAVALVFTKFNRFGLLDAQPVRLPHIHHAATIRILCSALSSVLFAKPFEPTG